MTPQDFLTHWRAEADRLERLGSLVNPARLIAEILADAESAFGSDNLRSLSLVEAAQESGYSPGHLGRLVREGILPNAGRPNAPRIRSADLPRKAAGLRARPSAAKLVGATPGQIARSVVTSNKGHAR